MSSNARARVACELGWFDPERLEPITAGRINDSFRVVDRATGVQGVLQAINARVFPQAVQLCDQLERVVVHLNRQQPQWVPQLLATRDGTAFLRHDDRVWRLWQYVEGETLQLEHCEAQLRLRRLQAAGAAFARTQVLLENLPGSRLQPAIGHHHDLTYYLERFEPLAAHATPQWRERIATYREQPFGELAHDGYIHGDCKPDNLLFHCNTADVAAVLDLDTVMWGSRALDFGDLVRSSVWVAEQFDRQSFVALLDGFVAGQSGAAQPCSASALAAAPVYISFMLSLRYLIDHLQGDVEFKVTRNGDNLLRAERQFQRTAALSAQRADTESLVAARLA